MVDEALISVRSEPPSSRRLALGCLLKIVLVTGVGFIALLVAAAVLFSGCDSNLDFSTHRKHLKAIPIPRSSCADVRVLHKIANEIQQNEPIPVFDVSGNVSLSNPPLAWPSPARQHQQRFRAALIALDVAITTSGPRFPPRLRFYLTQTQRDDRRGRVEIDRTFYGFVSPHPATDLLETGQKAFGFASDLVGTQCGVRLQADNGTMPDPFLIVVSLNATTTTTLPPR